MKRFFAIALALGMVIAPALAQVTGDQLGDHNMTPGGTSPVKGSVASACLYCHAPHGGMTSPTPLWNQQLSIQTYSMYTSTTYHQTGLQPPIGNPSKLCLSCHDGTVAPGQTIAFGRLTTSGSMRTASMFGTDLRGSHPFSLKTPLTNVVDINALLFDTPAQTADPKVKLVSGSIECTTCHEPHFQSIDKIVQMFLVRDSSNGALCLACHDPNRTMSGQTNYLANWAVSAHATATNGTPNTPYVGGYSTVSQNACEACHMPHNASGPARLLRGPDEQDCVACHNGTGTQPTLRSVWAEYSKTGHPFPTANNLHDRTETALLNNNRHATCVDCHSPHAAQPVAVFGPAPTIRVSQNAVAGISAADGTTVLTPAVNQYENCLRCHGTSIGKISDPKYGYIEHFAVNASDPLNVIPQFSSSATSSHPVTHDRSSALPQPSLRAQMLQLDGVTPGRAMGTRILCTDCHNADDNREFGGNGPNGPHGSKWTHILERRYEMSQAASPGSTVINPFPNPDLTVNGPYALCAKCHDLSVVLSPTSVFTRHYSHVVTDGMSCSTCHTAHGMGATSPYIAGQRLVNFDTNVVGTLGNQPVQYSRATRSCTLVCHSKNHNKLTY